MVPEAPLEPSEHGLVAQGDGWFVLNAGDTRWRPAEGPLLIVEGEERSLREWDFVHCPAGTKPVIVGAGSRRAGRRGTGKAGFPASCGQAKT
jgi:hypothetical protein